MGAGNVDTEFIPRHYDTLFPSKVLSKSTLCEAVLATVLSENIAQPSANDMNSPFNSLTGARFNHLMHRTVVLSHAGGNYTVSVTSKGSGVYNFTIGDQTFTVGGKLKKNDDLNFTELVTDIEGNLTLFTKKGSYEFSKPVPKYKLAGGSSGSLGDAVAPMPGVIEKVLVEDGSVVAAGDPLIVMIAMKMEYVIKAPKAGTVIKVNSKLGDFVEKGKVLVAFEDD